MIFRKGMNESPLLQYFQLSIFMMMMIAYISTATVFQSYKDYRKNKIENINNSYQVLNKDLEKINFMAISKKDIEPLLEKADETTKSLYFNTDIDDSIKTILMPQSYNIMNKINNNKFTVHESNNYEIAKINSVLAKNEHIIDENKVKDMKTYSIIWIFLWNLVVAFLISPAIVFILTSILSFSALFLNSIHERAVFNFFIFGRTNLKKPMYKYLYGLMVLFLYAVVFFYFNNDF